MVRMAVLRFISMLVTLLLVSMIVFFLVSLPPGDFAESVALSRTINGERVTEQDIEIMRVRLGLDKPLGERYLYWMGNILTEGDFGMSFRYMTPVTDIIADRLGLTALLVLLTLLLTYAIAIPVGVFSAVYQYSLPDYFITFLGYIGLAIPNFLMARVLLYFSVTVLNISGVGSLFSPEYQDAPWSIGKVVDLLLHLWVPATVLGLSGTAGGIRVMRATMLDELNRLYVTAARARGVPSRRLIWKYPVRIALNPIISTIGWNLRDIASGAPIVAIVLNLPDIGPVFLQALLDQDMFLAGTLVLYLSFLTILGTFVSDLLLAWLDPRIRRGAVK
ncbi:MAG: ABC transporter permease [Chloroflexota bacterium]